jgi:hypothetical protein
MRRSNLTIWYRNTNLVPGLCHETLQGFWTAGNQRRPLVRVNGPEYSEIVAANFCRNHEQLTSVIRIRIHFTRGSSSAGPENADPDQTCKINAGDGSRENVNKF